MLQVQERSAPLASLVVLARHVRGDVLLPHDDAYESARQVWNAAADARPAAIVRAADARDVGLAVRFARDARLPLAVRSGGHSPAGLSAVEGGVLLDLSRLRELDIDPVARTARLGAGLTWGEVAQALQPHGLALTSGDTSTVGVGGLTLGGGIGWMARKHGLAVDRLRAVELVTANGEVVRASADEHPELFWALRGGGGNFGVATKFEFDLHDGGLVLGGAVFYTAENAAEILEKYAAFALGAPDELTTMALVIAAPPAPFVPAEAVGRPLVGIVVCWSGDVEEGERAVAPLRTFGRVVADLISPMPYPAMFNFAEAGTLRGMRHFSRTMFLNRFGREEAETLAGETLAILNPGTLVQLRALGGAMSRVPRSDTAFSHRDKNFLLLISNMTPVPEAAPPCEAATERVYAAMKGFERGLYGNFAGSREFTRTSDAYAAETLARLEDIKRAYDPANLFSRNVNVRPG